MALERRLKVLVLGGLLLGAVIFVTEALTRDSALAPRFVKRHTPTLEIRAPETLAGLPLLKETPSTSFAMWFPGAEWRLRRRWLDAYPAVRTISFEKQFGANRIIARVEPRIPL